MAPNRNLRTHNVHALGSPLPTIVCPYCPRHFRSRGGRTKHIRAYHQDESGPPVPNPSAPLPIPHPSSQPASPIPSDHTPPLPDGSSITRVYHPKLDGKVEFFLGMHRH